MSDVRGSATDEGETSDAASVGDAAHTNAAIAEARRRVDELLNAKPITEDVKAAWFTQGRLCDLCLLQDHTPGDFGAVCARVRSRKFVYMKDLERALQGHRRECAGGHAPEAPGARSSKESQATQLVNLAHARGVELFHDEAGNGYATIRVGYHKETWRIGSKEFADYLRREFHAAFGRVPNSTGLRDAVAQLESEARSKGLAQRVCLRIAEHAGKVYVDLCNTTWGAVEIDAEGWRVVKEPPVKFVRTKGMLPLPAPVHGGSLEELRQFVNVAGDADFRLLVAFILAGMQPVGPKLGLAVSGEQGSAKSTLLSVLRRLLDPNTAETRSLPKDLRTLMIAAYNSAMLSFDNVSWLDEPTADALCRIMTGAAHSERTHYTDLDETLIAVTRPVMLNGIPDLATRSDLADRMITLELLEIPDDKRRDEKEFWAEFEEARPRILGALCDAVAGALRELPNVKIEKLPRMADAAKWVTAAEEALGWEPGTFVADYNVNHGRAREIVLAASPVPAALRAFLMRKGTIQYEPLPPVLTWQGTATALHDALGEGVAAEEKRNFPKTPNTLGTVLRRLAPALRSDGIRVEFERNPDRGRERHVKVTQSIPEWFDDQDCVIAALDSVGGSATARDWEAAAGLDPTTFACHFRELTKDGVVEKVGDEWTFTEAGESLRQLLRMRSRRAG